jgi:uncharacterized protein
MATELPTLPRSAGTNPRRRVRQSWPSGKDFRILSLDGGGIRGIFTAGVLASLEDTETDGQPIGDFFDLIVGTSTGGIIAMGLGAGKRASEIRDLYLHRGQRIFPQYGETWFGKLRTIWRDNVVSAFTHRHDPERLRLVLHELLGTRLFGESRYRHVIPSFDGKFSEVALLKTRHHPDYLKDWQMRMVDVCMATAAAPAIFRAFEHDGFRMVDGGIWANNPAMLGVVEAMTTHEVLPEQIRVLSIGTGDEPYVVSPAMMKGGYLHWRKAIFAAMRLQSLAATNQASLLVGPANVVRIDPTHGGGPIALDDYRRAVRELLPVVAPAIASHRSRIASLFLHEPASKFSPVP